MGETRKMPKTPKRALDELMNRRTDEAGMITEVGHRRPECNQSPTTATLPRRIDRRLICGRPTVDEGACLSIDEREFRGSAVSFKELRPTPISTPVRSSLLSRRLFAANSLS